MNEIIYYDNYSLSFYDGYSTDESKGVEISLDNSFTKIYDGCCLSITFPEPDNPDNRLFQLLIQRNVSTQLNKKIFRKNFKFLVGKDELNKLFRDWLYNDLNEIKVDLKPQKYNDDFFKKTDKNYYISIALSNSKNSDNTLYQLSIERNGVTFKFLIKEYTLITLCEDWLEFISEFIYE